MRIIATCLLMLVTAACKRGIVDTHPGLETTRGLSSLLRYVIIFHPSTGANEANFQVVLTNVCPETLKVMVNAKKFHGGFTVKTDVGENFDILDAEYSNMLGTATWIEPYTVLKPADSLTWKVFLRTLVSKRRDEPVTEELLRGSMVYSKMRMGIVPKSGNFLGDNADQESNAIMIQVNSEQADGKTPEAPQSPN